MQPELAIYRALGLPCVEVCLRARATGSAALRARSPGVTLLVGQSGVGKSSIVNALVPEAAAQTAELTRDAEGRHTTTTARWYRSAATSAIVDAPGVRDFAPPAQPRARRGARLRRDPRRRAAAAASTIAVISRSPAARCARRWRADASPRGAMKATGGCCGSTRSWRRTNDRLLFDAVIGDFLTLLRRTYRIRKRMAAAVAGWAQRATAPCRSLRRLGC